MPATGRKSPAKINLTLRVAGVRPDGFHEIESLVARVGMYDTVSVTPRDDEHFTLACDNPSIPCDETNLALRAARRLATAFNLRDAGIHVTLQKRIPAGAGLGGGSSNAATTLMLLNDLWKLNQTPEQLAALGAEIGSDVPLFFHTPLCVVRGRGQRVEDLRRPLIGWVTLVLPAIHSTTREVYAAWDRMTARPARPSLGEILRHADHAETLMPHLFNDLEPAALAQNPALGELAGRLAHLSDDTVRMTGSGSAFFRLFGARGDADGFGQRVRDELGLPVETVPIET